MLRSLVFFAFNRRTSLWCGVIILSLFVFSPDLVAQNKCSYVEGDKDGSGVCSVKIDALLDRATQRVIEEFNSGTEPNTTTKPKVVALIQKLQLLLRLGDPKTFAQDLIEQNIESLDSAIEDYHRSLVEKPEDIDALIGPLTKKLFIWQVGSKPDLFSKFAEGLNEYLTNSTAAEKSIAFRNGLSPEFKNLIATIIENGKTNASDTLGHVSQKISGFIETNHGAIKPANDVLYATLFDTTSGFTKDLEIIENEGERPAPATLRRAISLNEQLAKAFPAKNAQQAEVDKAQTFRQALARNDVVSMLRQVRAKAENLVDPLEPKIHIVRAWYGHLGKRWSEGKQCRATTAMQSLCERKANCNAPTKSAPILDAISLCGLNPAPFARGLARGLVVKYTCESGDHEFWADLANDPLTNPQTGQPYNASNLRTAVLRSSVMKINCSFPAP